MSDLRLLIPQYDLDHILEPDCKVVYDVKIVSSFLVLCVVDLIHSRAVFTLDGDVFYCSNKSSYFTRLGFHVYR